MLIGQAITDYNVGSFYYRGLTLATHAEFIFVSDLVRTGENRIDAIGTFRGTSVHIAMIMTGKIVAEAVGKVVRCNEGRTFAEILAMGLSAN